MHSSTATARDITPFSLDSAHADDTTGISLAIKLSDRGCEAAAAAVLEGRAYDAGDDAWQARRARAVAEIEARLAAEAEREDAYRPLDPITPIDLPAEVEPDDADLDGAEDFDPDLDVLAARAERKVERRGPGVARRALRAEDRRLLAAVLAA